MPLLPLRIQEYARNPTTQRVGCFATYKIRLKRLDNNNGKNALRIPRLQERLAYTKTIRTPCVYQDYKNALRILRL